MGAPSAFSDCDPNAAPPPPAPSDSDRGARPPAPGGPFDVTVKSSGSGGRSRCSARWNCIPSAPAPPAGPRTTRSVACRGAVPSHSAFQAFSTVCPEKLSAWVPQTFRSAFEVGFA